MNKKDFIKYLDNSFKNYGLEKKGKCWLIETDELQKVISLEKSKYGNCYYLNYGYILKNVDLRNLEMHIYKQLNDLHGDGNSSLKELLDFDKNVSDEHLIAKLNVYIKNMVQELMNINSEDDVLSELKKRSHLNDIPLVVKKYFRLS